jgi:hypothetical protein
MRDMFMLKLKADKRVFPGKGKSGNQADKTKNNVRR